MYEACPVYVAWGVEEPVLDPEAPIPPDPPPFPEPDGPPAPPAVAVAGSPVPDVVPVDELLANVVNDKLREELDDKS
jgi:hypothetical protein